MQFEGRGIVIICDQRLNGANAVISFGAWNIDRDMVTEHRVTGKDASQELS